MKKEFESHRCILSSLDKALEQGEISKNFYDFIHGGAKHIPELDRRHLIYHHDNKDFHLLTPLKPIKTDKHYASIDSNAHAHIVLLEPDSPEISKCYDTLIHLINEAALTKSNKRHTGDKELTPRQILKIAKRLVKATLVKLDKSEENRHVQAEKINSTPIKTALNRKTHFLTTLSLDTYLRHQFGTCRQHALLLGFLIAKLVEDGYIPDGDVYHHKALVKRFKESVFDDEPRKFFEGSKHVFTMYQTKTGSLYLVDSRFNCVYTLSLHGVVKQDNVRKVRYRYGVGVIPQIASSFDPNIILEGYKTPNKS